MVAASLLCGLTAVLGAAMPVTAASSAVPQASPLTTKVVQSAWYWYKQVDAAAGTGVEAAPEPSGVPKDDTAVAYTGGTTTDGDQPSKETFLAFDLSGITKGALITAFSFTIALDKKSPQLKTAQPALIACLPVRTWTNGLGQPWVEKPSEDCSTTIAADGKYDSKARTYTFSIPAIAQLWISDFNTGVAIRHKPAVGNAKTAPFQMNFAAPTAVTARLTFEPAVVTTPSDPGVQQPNPTEQVPPVDTSGGSGSLDSGGLGSVPAPSVDSGAPGAGTSTTGPSPQLAPRPMASGKSIDPAASLPSVGFWLVGAAALAVLLLISLVVGDTTGTSPASPAQRLNGGSRLDRVLRARRTPLTLEPR
jgi:hypothetical protein